MMVVNVIINRHLPARLSNLPFVLRRPPTALVARVDEVDALVLWRAARSRGPPQRALV